MWIRMASVSLPLTFNKFDWQDFFQGLKFGLNASLIGLAAFAVAMIALALFAALRPKRDSGPDNSE
jgi:hypothetical protein